METLFKIDDVVMFRANPNSGEMIVFGIYNKVSGFPEASTSNPVIKVCYWDERSKDYEYRSFYSNHLILVRRE